MAGTNISVCRRIVVDRLTTVAAQAGSALAASTDRDAVTVEYSYPGRSPQRELIYTGRAEGTQEPAAMRAGGRVPRVEDAVVDLHIEVAKPGATPREVDQRAEEIAQVAIELLAGDPQLANQAAGLLFGGAAGAESDPAEVDNDGATANLTLRLSFQSYLK
jgi:hypothetical protein